MRRLAGLFCPLLFLILTPPIPEFLIQSKDGGVELFAAYHRWVAVEVFGYGCWCNWRRSANHADVLPGSADVAVCLKDLGDHIIDLWRLRNRRYTFETLSLPAFLFTALPGPVSTPAICRYCFSAVSAARSLALVMMSRAARTTVQ